MKQMLAVVDLQKIGLVFLVEIDKTNGALQAFLLWPKAFFREEAFFVVVVEILLFEDERFCGEEEEA